MIIIIIIIIIIILILILILIIIILIIIIIIRVPFFLIFGFNKETPPNKKGTGVLLGNLEVPKSLMFTLATRTPPEAHQNPGFRFFFLGGGLGF